MPTKTARKGKPKPVAPATDKPTSFLVNVVLDRSGSMESNAAGTISGYNEYLNGLKADKDNEYNVSLIQFDAVGTAADLTVSYMDKPLAEVPDLNAETYQPRGGTPLYDAIGECIRRVEAKGRGVITVIITDGQENSSREFNQASIKALIHSKEAEGWSFVFLGANIDAVAVGDTIGLSAASCANYAKGFESQTFSNVAASNSLRAATYKTMGMQAAVSMCAFTDEQRASMTGGHPVSGSGANFSVAFKGGAPSAGTFQRQPPIPTGTSPRKPRSWRVNEPVPQP